MNKESNNFVTIIISAVIALVFLGVGFFLGEKTAPLCTDPNHSNIEKELAVLEAENKNLKEKSKKDTESEKESNIYTYSDDLPWGGSCVAYDNDMDNFMNSLYEWGGATTTISDVMYNYEIYEVESYDNGTIINMDSVNPETGNYNFKVFFDRDKDKYIVLNVKDKDNGKTYKSPDSIQTYLEDVYRRIIGI